MTEPERTGALLDALEVQASALTALSGALEAQRAASGTPSLDALDAALSELDSARARVEEAATRTLAAATAHIGRPVARLADLRDQADLGPAVERALDDVRSAAHRAQRDLRINARIMRQGWLFGDSLLRAATGAPSEPATYGESPMRRDSDTGEPARIVDGTA